MNERQPEVSTLCASSNSPFTTSADMSHHEEQTAATLASLSNVLNRHTPALDYADKNFYRFHHQAMSSATAASGSNDSSPTTTASTVDDSSATEPSPGSSPESPPPSGFTTGMLRPRTSDDVGAPFFELQKSPPPKKGRNLKNLAVNTSRHPRAASTTSLPLQPSTGIPVAPAAKAAPPPTNDINPLASPTFVKPASPPRRKPSNLGLTLLTPGSSKSPPQEIRLSIPSTPGFARPGTLRHFQSSPSLPLVPGLASGTGFGFVGPHLRQPLETILSPIEPTKPLENEEEEEQNFDVPLSKEEKPEAYPEGPICVYEPYIDLYLEPTAEQCHQYDVIVNVASEVHNPLVKRPEVVSQEPDIRLDGGGGIQFAPKRPRLSVAKEENDIARDSPTTPKATPLNSVFPGDARSEPTAKLPEYIHVPWEHNSDIVPDLLRLVKMLDDRVKQGKRVLVHCQCGVSRSASLVVAYGLYKDPTMSVQEAYDAIKKRSKWIGPNMNLIMQLQEFRTSLARGGLLPGNRGLTPITPSSAYSEWRGPFSANPSDTVVRPGPMSAGVQTVQDSMPALTPGPSSAPSGLQWPPIDQAIPAPTQRARAISAIKPPASAYVDPSGHIVPVLKVIEPEQLHPKTYQDRHSAQSNDDDEQDAATPTESMASPRSAEFAMTPLQPPKDVDPADSFGIMSPTSTEFSSSPFDRPTLLASLGMGSMEAGAPRRPLSLQQRAPAQPDPTELPSADTTLRPTPGLRAKISAPNLREQQELQSLQTQIQASLPPKFSHDGQLTGLPVAPGDADQALMSPRAIEFTKNPFALALSIPEQAAAETTANETPRSTDSDPRSPAHAGVSPITRNIMDVL